jgi:hypothetical protein
LENPSGNSVRGAKQMKLGIYEFGRQLLETEDLDPVYVILWEAELPTKKLHRWLLAYWCFYHVGVASYLSEYRGDEFYTKLMESTFGTTHPRGTERRHFRGQQAKVIVESFIKSDVDPSKILHSLDIGKKEISAKEVMYRVKTLRGFGDWISFKVADMLERLGICPVQFKPEDIFEMFDSPRKGAELMEEKHGPAKGNTYTWAHNQLLRKFRTYTAPPRHERRINIQEIETILCKWKSHLSGHYKVGKDTVEIEEGLRLYGTCKTSRKLLNAGEKGGLW